MLVLMTLAIVANTVLSGADQRLSRMAALYDQVCLRAFPDDNAVATLMKAAAARELSSTEVRVTMLEDPARGWELPDGAATVWIEFPPFHACSVRWSTPQADDLSPYRAIADSYEYARSGFKQMATYDADKGDIHIHAAGEQRTGASKATESLFVIEQHINDPKQRDAGKTGVVLRFVHQFTQTPP